MQRSDWERLRRELGRTGTAHPTLLVALADAALFALSCWLNVRGTLPCVLAATALFAFVLLHAYLLHHEACHRAVFRSARANAALGHLAGWLLALPFLPRQRSHALHHAWTGHPEGDPANRRAIERLGALGPRAARRLDRLWRLGVPFLVLNDRVGLWRESLCAPPALPDGAPAPGARRARIERRWACAYLAGYALAGGALAHAGLLGAALRVWLPALLLCMVAEELANLPHHAETPLIDSPEPLPPWAQHRVTHGCRHVPIWSSVVLLHFNLHVAHHAFPWLPWYRLPRAQRAMAALRPALAAPRSESEVGWALTRRRRGFLDVLGHYFVQHARARNAHGRGGAVTSAQAVRRAPAPPTGARAAPCSPPSPPSPSRPARVAASAG